MLTFEALFGLPHVASQLLRSYYLFQRSARYWLKSCVRSKVKQSVYFYSRLSKFPN